MNIKTVIFFICIGIILFFTIQFFLEKREMQNGPASLLAVEDIRQGTFLLWGAKISLIDGIGEFQKDNQLMQISFYTPTGLVSLSETMAVGIMSLTQNINSPEFYIVLFSLEESSIQVIDSRILSDAVDVADLFVDYNASNDAVSLLYVSIFVEDEKVRIPVTYQVYASSEGFTFLPQSDGSLSEEVGL